MFRLSFVYIVIPDQWQKAMIYLWNWIVVFVPGAGQARDYVHVLTGIWAAKCPPQHAEVCSLIVLNVFYMYRMLNEWVNEWVNEWMNELYDEWMNSMMKEWIVWWMNEWIVWCMNEWIVWWMNEWIVWWMNSDEWMNYCGMYGLIYVIVFVMCCIIL